MARADQTDTSANTPEKADDGVYFGPLEHYFGHHLRRLQKAFEKGFIEKAKEYDMHPRDMGGLWIIALNPGISPQKLTSAVQQEPAQTSFMLNALERRGFIERRTSESDGRSRNIYLTPEGEEVHRKLVKLATQFDRDFVSTDLTAEEKSQLIYLLKKLSDARTH